MTVMGDLLDKILIPLRPQSVPSRQERDSISEEKTDAGEFLVIIQRVMMITLVKGASEGACSTVAVGKVKEIDRSKTPITGEKIFRPWDAHLEENKSQWKDLSVKGSTIPMKTLGFIVCQKLIRQHSKDQQRRQEEAKAANPEE